MKATDVLAREHELLRGLFRRYEDACAADPPLKAEVFRELRQKLRAHARLEEEVFYPAVMKVRSLTARGTVRGGLEEHHALEGLLAELEGMDVDDARFDGKVAQLRDSVERHIREEESEMFAYVLQHLSEQRLEQLGAQLEARRTIQRRRAAPFGKGGWA